MVAGCGRTMLRTRGMAWCMCGGRMEWLHRTVLLLLLLLAKGRRRRVWPWR